MTDQTSETTNVLEAKEEEDMLKETKERFQELEEYKKTMLPWKPRKRCFLRRKRWTVVLKAMENEEGWTERAPLDLVISSAIGNP